MQYDPDLHHRRSIRLKDYDYSQAGGYFVTICMHNHLCLLGEVEDGVVYLNDAGRMVQEVWQAAPLHYPGVGLDAFVVMPNHVHGIILLAGNDPTPDVGAGPRACPNRGHTWPALGQPQGVAPTDVRLMLGDVVHRFKSLTTAGYREGVLRRGWSPFNGRLWQRNYYEHVIRNERDLDEIREYIIANPGRWSEDKENPVNL